MLDTALEYELPVMNRLATELFSAIPEGIERYAELKQVLPAIQLFGEIDEALVAPDSLVARVHRRRHLRPVREV